MLVLKILSLEDLSKDLIRRPSQQGIYLQAQRKVWVQPLMTPPGFVLSLQTFLAVNRSISRQSQDQTHFSLYLILLIHLSTISALFVNVEL